MRRPAKGTVHPTLSALFALAPAGGKVRREASKARNSGKTSAMIVSVVYPKTETSHFDHEYYTQKHLPLVQRTYGAHGMLNAKIMRGTSSLGGAPVYELIALLEFKDMDSFLKAAGAHSDEVMGDVPRFTDIKPIVQFNDSVA